MIEISIKLRNGSTRLILVELGQTLMQALRAANVDGIDAICGGSCACATCHVYLVSSTPGVFPEAKQDERDLVECSDHYNLNSRLSCQLRLDGSASAIEIEIPQSE